MDVEAILAASTAQHKSTEVNKDVELQFDLRNLLATDLNSLDTETLRYIAQSKNFSACSYAWRVDVGLLNTCIK